jgi:Uma2 family endonuclease
MQTIPRARRQRLRLSSVSWRDYLRWLRAAEGRHLRISYDRGELEIMTLSNVHEWFASFFGQIVEVLTEELDMTRLSAGSTTLKRKLFRRGLEADRSYYLKNEPHVRAKDKIDLRVDPAPDLAIEIDITSSSLNRLSIYAKLKVAEVWRFDGTTVRAYHLGPNGKYTEADHSLSFPGLKLADLLPFLEKRKELGETDLLRSFREWVRRQIAAGMLRKP